MHDTHNHQEIPDKCFIHLHVHDEFSSLDGVQRIAYYPKYAKETLGFKSIAQTNHGNMAGSWSFYKSCKAAGIKPLLGEEFYYSSTDHTIKEKDELGKPYYHVIGIALNNTGLKNMFRLSSRAYTEGSYYKPRISDQMLFEHSEGIAITTACLGSRTSQLILKGEYKAAERMLDLHSSVFKDRFFVELQLHTMPDQQKVNEALIHIAKAKNLPLVITADAHYTHQHQKHFHELTLRMNTGRNIDDDDAFSFGDIQCHLHSHEEMVSGCTAQNIPLEAITNTAYVADMVNADDYFSDRKNRIPKFKSLPEGITSWAYLEAVAWAGLTERVGFPIPEEYEARFRKELRLFKKLGMCDYMLTIWEIIHTANSLDCWVGPGRGSVAGSLIAWALGITQLDPIKYGLLVERFVHEGRSGAPLIF